MIKRCRQILVLAVALGLVAAVPGAGKALYSAHDRVVSADPAENTPHVADCPGCKVNAILPMGNRVFVGGVFTHVHNKGESGRLIPRSGLFAFDPNTGLVDESFVANFDGAVEALAPAPDGQSFFVAGDFGTLNGVPMRKLAKLSVTSGAPDPGFSVSLSQAVKDIAVADDKLIIAGIFTRVGGAERLGLAAVDLDNGGLSSLNVAFTVPRQGTLARVETIAVTPDGETLVAGGNFTVANGQPRYQIALVDIDGNRLVDWRTDRFDDRRPASDPKFAEDPFKCSEAFDTHIRDIDVSPDGTYFAVVTTGGFSRGTMCDTVSRWEMSARGSSLQPTWVAYDGGDSFTGVAVTGAAIYAGGHNRWMNNPFPNGSSTDATPGPGAVAHEGIVALHPANGLPLPWNAARERGEGAWAIVSSPGGLWVGSDTNLWGPESNRTTRKKLAFLPLDGGFHTANFTAQGLAGDLYTMGLDGSISRRYFDGAVTGSRTVLQSGIDWSKVRGAFALSGRLYTGQDSGKLLARSFDGSRLGPAVEVPLRGLTSTHFPISRVTGMFVDSGRLYYTISGDRKLYYRYFLPEANVANDVVGAETLVASGESDGLDWSKVEGMTYAGGRIYFSEAGGLYRIDFSNGRPRGTAAQVAASSAAGAPFASRGMFLMPPTSGPPPGSIDPPEPPPAPPTGTDPASGRSGYWMVGSDGAVYAFGNAAHMGNATPFLAGHEAVDLEPTASYNGYWIVDDIGRVYGFGDARHLGNVDRARLAGGEKVTSLSATPSGNGYWIFTTRGRAVPFGDARHFGDMSAVRLNGPVLDSIPTPSGNGYYMVASDGGIFALGDARFYGSMGGKPLNGPVQSLVPDPDGTGYWLVASDGGVFAFEAGFRGSMGGKPLNKPMTGMVPFGNGYLMVATDGGIFNFSDLPFLGSLGNNPPARPVVSVAARDE
jgi:hypothetical protein